ncbi:type IV pilin (plasmid) [Halorussus vallis]|uniref:type IV pilin n=1 Tax=Halorussus vallis TaxID=2953749 RepID=UPI00209D0262|nr:type IV pilin [Halorussus vallis]USZ77937.1 type IV pilin [Halorussus vallis]
MKRSLERLAAGVRSERATSPTIGSVLLVGVTVLLATTAGAGMFSLAEQGTQGAFATATVSTAPSEDRVTATWVANANAERLQVTIRVGDRSRTVTLQSVGDRVVADPDGVSVQTGDVVRWDRPAISDGDRISVTVVAVKNGESVVVAEQSAAV